MVSGLSRQCGRGRAPERGDIERVRIYRGWPVGARKASNHVARCIENLQRDRAGRRGLQVVVDEARRTAGSRPAVRPCGCGVPFSPPRRRGDRVGWAEQERISPRYVVGDLTQRRDAVEDPETAAVRRDDRGRRRGRRGRASTRRQVELQRLPVVAGVERHEHGQLGAREQQARAPGVFCDRLQVDARRQAVRDLLPRATAVAGAVDVGLVVGRADGDRWPRTRCSRRSATRSSSRPCSTA